MKHTKTLLLSIALSIVLLGTAQHSALAFPPSTGTAHEPAAVSFFDLISQFFFGNAAGETSANQYSDAITAEMVDANMPGSLTIHGTIDSTGTALPGIFQITLQYNHVNQTVIGGQWTRIVEQYTDGKSVVTGTLHGDIRSGSVVLNDRGQVASLSGVELSVTRGSGDFAQVTSGSGTFEGTIRSADEPVPAPTPEPSPAADPSATPGAGSAPTPPARRPVFSGTINLTF